MGGIHHLVSRGVELAYQQAGNGEKMKLDMPTWVPILLAATAACHLFLHIAATYTFGLLVPTLTMVETPSTTAIVRTTERYHDDESPDAPLLSKEEKESQKPRVDEEIMLVAHKPRTGKLRTIMRHLRKQTGSPRAHWRGVGGFIIYNIATMWAVGFARSIIPVRMCAHLLHIPVAGLLCLLSTAWIQQMVAMPGKNYFQRVSELARAGAFKKLILPVIAVEVVETAVFMLPRQLSILFGFAGEMSGNENTNTGLIAAGIILASFTFFFSLFFVVVPLNIGLVRLQASMLSEETETVVPMDRTLDGAEVKSIKSAWKSFTREGCHRLAKNYIKYFMVQAGLTVMFVLTIACQLYLIFGSDAIKVVRKHVEEHKML